MNKFVSSNLVPVEQIMEKGQWLLPQESQTSQPPARPSVYQQAAQWADAPFVLELQPRGHLCKWGTSQSYLLGDRKHHRKGKVKLDNPRSET